MDDRHCNGDKNKAVTDAVSLFRDNKTKSNIAGNIGFLWAWEAAKPPRAKTEIEPGRLHNTRKSHCFCRHLVAVDILLLLSLCNKKPERQHLERQVHDNGTI